MSDNPPTEQIASLLGQIRGWQQLAEDRLANVEHLREQRDGLLKAAKELVGLLDNIGEQTDWRDQDDTDRVFSWDEFHDLRVAIQRAEESPLAKAVRIARGHQGPPTEPVEFT